MRLHVVRLFLFATTLSVLTSSVSAQTGIDDFVRTRDGASYRGTIVESVPGSHVTLMSPSGQTRRFAEAEIDSFGRFAGGADATPTPAGDVVAVSPEPAAESDESLHLSVTADAAGYTLMVQAAAGTVATNTGTALFVAYERLCTAPCEFDIERGSYNFVIEDARGRHVNAGRADLDADGQLHIGVTSRRRTRIIRIAVGGGLFVVGLATMMASMRIGCSEVTGSGRNCDNFAPGIALGSLGFAAGGALGIAGMLTFDRGRVTFSPSMPRASW